MAEGVYYAQKGEGTMRRLDQPFEEWGDFGRGLDSEDKFRGKLSYDPASGIDLELGSNPFPEGETGTLYGELANACPVTLERCFMTESSGFAGSPWASPTKVCANRAVFGCHAENVDEIVVTRLCTRLSSLLSWSGLSVFDYAMDVKPFRVTFACPGEGARDICVGLPCDRLRAGNRSWLWDQTAKGEVRRRTICSDGD